MRSQIISAQAWSAACEVTYGRPETSSDPMKHWEAAGWLDHNQHLDHSVSSLIYSHLSAPIIFNVSSTFNDLQILAQISVCDSGLVTSHTARFKLVSNKDGQISLAGADPNIEFIIEQGANPWPLIARTLPPLEVLSASPKQTPSELVERVDLGQQTSSRFKQIFTGSVDGDPASFSQLLAQAGALLPEVKASVALTVLARSARDTIGIGGGAWLAGTQLFRLLASPEDIGLEKVQPGDLGFRATWLMLGARERCQMEAHS